MSYSKIILSDAYQRRLGEIEDFIWESSGNNMLAMEAFFASHDSILEFLKQNPTTPPRHPQTGDQSWPFGDGRYRLFFKFKGKDIELLDLIDNRMSNFKVYPNNVLPTYNDDE
jgi:hypothetical protein